MGCGDALSMCVHMCACAAVRVCMFVCEVCTPWQEVGLQPSNVRVMPLMSDPGHSPAQKPSLKSRVSLSVSNALRLEDAV